MAKPTSKHAVTKVTKGGWVYPRAQVLSIHDGDNVTARVDIDLGFQETFSKVLDVRLLGGNLRELTAPGGAEAQAYVASLTAGAIVSLTSVKYDKYGGRVDATITLPDGRDLMGLLISEGWAAKWDGNGPKPVPPWPRQALT